MVMVKPASMLFGGGANRCSVGVFRLMSRFILESAVFVVVPLFALVLGLLLLLLLFLICG
jgi:hypothetical protein